jgi:acyl transferase domain-containing protein
VADSLLAGMKRSPSDMLLHTPTQTVRTVERDLAAAKRAAAREAAGAEREIMALKRQVAAQQADAKDDGDMLAGCRESIENLRKEKAEMKIELDAAKNTAIAVYNCAMTLRGTEQRTQEKAAWLLKKAQKYKRALKKAGGGAY